MNDVEFKVSTGLTLADALRIGIPDLAKVEGWGNGTTTGCALTTVAKVLKDRGYV